MATTTVFIVYNTAGAPVAAIQPNTVNGPTGVQQSSDLSLFGIGYPTWGQAADQNDYRLLENFACGEDPSNPGNPLSATTLGTGNGINAPVIGQLWFNTTQNKMFVNTDTGWQYVASTVAVSTTQPSVPVSGDLWYNTSIPQLEVWNGSAWTSVAALYLPLAGGTMTGNVSMGNHDITNVGDISTATVQANAYQAPNGNTTNQITIPNSGNTSATDGPRIGSNVIIHTGNIGSFNAFSVGMIMMCWQQISYPTTAFPGWAPCDGGTYNGHTTPDMRNRFPMGAGSAYSYNQSIGTTTLNLTTSTAGSHNHGGATGGTSLSLAQIPGHNHVAPYAEDTYFGVSGSEYATPSLAAYFGTFVPYPGQNVIGSSGSDYNQTALVNTSMTGGVGSSQNPPHAGAASTHTHSIATDGSHNHSVSISWNASSLPPAKGVFFIMYVG